MGKIYLYDTTLRDGAQKEGVSFSVVDKLEIASRLDDLASASSRAAGLVLIPATPNFSRKRKH